MKVVGFQWFCMFWNDVVRLRASWNKVSLRFSHANQKTVRFVLCCVRVFSFCAVKQCRTYGVCPNGLWNGSTFFLERFIFLEHRFFSSYWTNWGLPSLPLKLDRDWIHIVGATNVDRISSTLSRHISLWLSNFRFGRVLANIQIFHASARFEPSTTFSSANIE